MKIVKIVPVLLVLLVSGCGDSSTEPTEIDINGTWTGTAAGISASLNLVESDGIISGDGSIETAGGTVTPTIAGTRDGTSVAFTLTLDGFMPAEFEGTIESENSIVGVLNESGFDNAPLTLTR